MDAFFLFKRLVGGLAQPLSIFWLALGLALLAWLLRRKRFAAWLAATGVALILVCSFPPLARRLATTLERRYPVVSASAVPEAIEAIVVLGSGVAHPNDRGLPALSRLGDTARTRLVEGVRLARLYPDVPLLTCGDGLGMEGCADVMAEAAVELGIEPGRVIRLSTAVDTAGEARLTRETVGRGARVAVVTSAVHMPRAMELFLREGLSATAAPCDFIAPLSDSILSAVDRARWQPRAAAVSEHERIWHEVLGLVYTHYLGKSDD